MTCKNCDKCSGDLLKQKDTSKENYRRAQKSALKSYCDGNRSMKGHKQEKRLPKKLPKLDLKVA
jgi:hypothetical protein